MLFFGPKKHQFTLVMSGTSNYAFAIGTLLIGLRKHSPNLFDNIVIYEEDFCENDKISMLKIFNFIDFRQYNCSIFKNLPETDNIKRYSKLSFAIYEIFNELKYSKKVLYLDGDILIQKDISNIINYGPVAMRPGGRSLENALGFHLDGLDNIKCRNSGVVFVSDSIPYKNLTQQCYDLTIKYWHKLFLPDQSILNLVLLNNNIPIHLFPLEYNNNLNNVSFENFMIHQTTKRKFWSNGVVNFLMPEWEINYNKWLNLGGSPFKGKMALKEFKELSNRKVDKLVFIAKIYRYVVEEFLRNLSLEFTDRFIVDVKNFTLLLQLPGFLQFCRFEIRFFGDECRYKFYCNEASVIENFTFDDSTLYIFNKSELRLEVVYIERLHESFMTYKDLFVEKINIFIHNVINMSKLLETDVK